VIVDRVVELGIGVVEDDEQVILVDGNDFLLEFTHGGSLFTKIRRNRFLVPSFQKSILI
jgi:hypothetical protein